MKTKILIVLSVIYFLTRLFNLLQLRIFLDESLYLRMISDSIKNHNLWISFTDGKEPLFFWLQAIFAVFFGNSLFTGRVVSVIFGYVILVATYSIAKQLYGFKGAVITSFLYILSPLFHFYNRLAVLDCFLTALLCVFLMFILKMFQNENRKTILFAGLTYGLALVTKTIAQVYIYFLFVLMIFIPQKRKIVAIFVIFFLAFVIHTLLYLAPGVDKIASKNVIFAHPLGYSLTHVTSVFIPNFKMSLRYWWGGYFGYLLMFTFCLGSALAFYRKNKGIIFLSTVFIVGFIFFSFVAKIFFPRYLFFLGIPFMLVTGYFFSELIIKFRRIGLLYLIICIFAPLYLTTSIMFDVDRAKLPEIERWQYIYGWPSGNCLQSTVTSLDNLIGGSRATIFVPDDGVAEFLKFEFRDKKNILLSTDKHSATNFIVFNYYDKEDITEQMVQLKLDNNICRQPPRVYEIVRKTDRPTV